MRKTSWKLAPAAPHGPAPRATKIVATIGTRADDPRELERLVAAGVDVVRINGAHCRAGEVRRRVAAVRAVERRLRRPIGVLLDLGGPKIRLGAVLGATEWREGDAVEIVPSSRAPKSAPRVHRVSVTYPALLSDVAPGAEVRIDDGRIRLQVVSRLEGALAARVVVGGRVRAGAGVNFPNSALTAPALTAKDRRDLREGLASGVDFVGLSFVRSAEHVKGLRRLLAGVPDERRPWIVAKIERVEALADLEAIGAAADVLMVARGDLGVEIGLASVPRAQREILLLGHRLSVPVIVATQMLESMVESPMPTRAEVSDVAGAVHDGADAVMLSGETAVGKFPVEAVRVMAEIARKAEVPDEHAPPPPPRRVSSDDFASVVADTACEAARQCRARAMVVYTERGRTARLVSKNPLSIPIYAFTSRDAVRRRLTILRDVVSFEVPPARTVEAMIRSGDRILRRLPELAGATVVELSGASKAEGATNTVRVRRLLPPPRR